MTQDKQESVEQLRYAIGEWKKEEVLWKEREAEMLKELSTTKASLEVCRVALEKLSRLGNEPHLGNSIGNRIAQDALTVLGTTQPLNSLRRLVELVNESIEVSDDQAPLTPFGLSIKEALAEVKKAFNL